MMQYWPKISVVTVNYNQEAFIERTLLSVLSQGYPNLEYIIIDGGSTDGSVEIIKKYEERLFYWTSEADNGMYHAIQKGFDLSSGEIMAYINSDDLLQPHSLFTVASIFLKNPNLHWLNGIPNNIDEFDRIVFVGEVPKWTKYHYLIGQYKYIQQEGIFWTRNLWNRAGACFNLNYKLAGDLELWSRFFSLEKLYYLPILIGSFRRRKSGQKSLEQLDEYLIEAEAIIESFKPSTAQEKKIVAKYKSILFKIALKLNRKEIYYFLGFSDLYNILFRKNRHFEFIPQTQEFKFIESQ
jgi:glycosyltransferase involved in cell wall biosynthesis